MRTFGLPLAAIAEQFLCLLEDYISPEGERTLISGRGLKIGDSVRLRRRPEMVFAGPFTLDAIGPVCRETAVRLNHHLSETISVEPDAFGLSLDEFSRRFLRTAASVLARSIDDRWGEGDLICAVLSTPSSITDYAIATDPDGGLSVRLVEYFNLRLDRIQIRWDILFGAMRATVSQALEPLLKLYELERASLEVQLAKLKRVA